MSVLQDLWGLLDRKQRVRAIVLQVVSLATAFSTILGIAAIIPFFTLLASPDAVDRQPALRWLFNYFAFESKRSFAVALGLGFIATVTLANLIGMLSSLATSRFAHEVGNRLHVALFREYLMRGYEFHAGSNHSELSSRILYDVGRVASGVLHGTLVLITSSITALAIIVAIVALNPTVGTAVVMSLGTAYALIFTSVKGRLRRNGATESRHFEKRVQLLNESFGAIKEVTLSQRQGFFVKRFAELCRSISVAISDTVLISQAPKYALECLVVSGLVGISLLFTAHEAMVGQWLGHLTFLAFAAYRLLPILQQGFAAAARIRADCVALDNIKADLQLARATQPNQMELPHIGPFHLRGAALRLDDVTFRYAASHRSAVRNVSLEIPAGRMVGIIGENGSGKTTLVDLIAGLLIPQRGSVSVNGVLLDRSNRAAWQASIAYVPQEIFVLNCSFAENIALGEPLEKIRQDRLRAAVRLAQLESCVDSWPLGYDQVLGERGVLLSGGQRQRVGLARAMYRDASLVILDEATSALDAIAAREFDRALQSMRGERTIIVIAHRLDAFHNCDAIYEMHEGGIRSCSSFESLLERSARHRSEFSATL
jgi:HlyD family secretion protein